MYMPLSNVKIVTPTGRHLSLNVEFNSAFDSAYIIA